MPKDTPTNNPEDPVHLKPRMLDYESVHLKPRMLDYESNTLPLSHAGPHCYVEDYSHMLSI